MVPYYVIMETCKTAPINCYLTQIFIELFDKNGLSSGLREIYKLNEVWKKNRFLLSILPISI